MQFSNETTKQGIVQKVRFLTKTTEETYPIEDITREVNNALDAYWVIAMQASNMWNLDDTTYSDYAVATTDLILNQSDYAMPAGLIDVEDVFLLNSANTWVRLLPIHQLEYPESLDTLTSSDPIYYEKKADGIFLYPPAQENKTNGLKLHYRRIPNYFLITDETREPGIPAIHHEYLTLPPSYMYNIKEAKAIKNDFVNLKQMQEENIKQYWSRRGKDKPVRIRPAYTSSE